MLLAVAAEKYLELAQFDVQTAFLYGKLDEEIFMEVPEGLDNGKLTESTAKNVVCRLEKSLYGLKQAPRCWNRELSAFLREFEFREMEADRCIYVGNVGNSVVYLSLFVDDGLIAAESNDIVENVFKHLSNSFETTIGDSSVFVGMQIERDSERKSIFVHQSAYAKRVIDKFGMSNAKSVSTTTDSHVVLHSVVDGEEKSENLPYREAVGSLMFLAIVSRPDLSYSVKSVSMYPNNHNGDHW